MIRVRIVFMLRVWEMVRVMVLLTVREIMRVRVRVSFWFR